MNPSAPILFDDAHTKGITYAKLDDMSGRVYGWLKQNGIGREDCCYFQQKEVNRNESGNETKAAEMFYTAETECTGNRQHPCRCTGSDVDQLLCLLPARG